MCRQPRRTVGSNASQYTFSNCQRMGGSWLCSATVCRNRARGISRAPSEGQMLRGLCNRSARRPGVCTAQPGPPARSWMRRCIARTWIRQNTARPSATQYRPPTRASVHPGLHAVGCTLVVAGRYRRQEFPARSRCHPGSWRTVWAQCCITVSKRAVDADLAARRGAKALQCLAQAAVQPELRWSAAPCVDRATTTALAGLR